jgi:hypothetical protein
MEPDPEWAKRMEARISDVEGFVSETRQWRRETDELSLGRHRDNDRRLSRIEGLQADTKSHLDRQDRDTEKLDKKLDKNGELLNQISLKLASQDGAMKLLKWAAGMLFGGGMLGILDYFWPHGK